MIRGSSLDWEFLLQRNTLAACSIGHQQAIPSQKIFKISAILLGEFSYQALGFTHIS